MNHNFFMKQAYKEALKARAINEVPIGCVIVYKDRIIAKSHNKRNTAKNSLYHGEILAINKACKVLGDWRLEGCSIFVTIEPCPMCAGAILQARMSLLVFGAKNPKAGSVVSINRILDNDSYNHKVKIIPDIMKEECSELMRSFFKKLRKRTI